MKPNAARWVVPFLYMGICWGFAGCSDPAPQAVEPSKTDTFQTSGILPNIKAANMSPAEAEAVTRWIEEAVALMQSPEFESNFRKASAAYPELFVSQKEDLVPSATVLARLQTRDPRLSALWWPESFVVLRGTGAARSPDRMGFGFDASRIAGAGPMVGNTKAGEIKLGRLHFARYSQGDTVEKSCALNTMVHEISHTLSERPGQFWMHILDSEDGVTAPNDVFEASYFIGTIAQCTYLKSKGRISDADFNACMMTFSDPTSGSRFKSLACDDFPGNKPITPQGRFLP